LKRLSLDTYKQYATLINFEINQILRLPISNSIKIFLTILPESLVPNSSLEIKDPIYLKYTKNVAPEIEDDFITQNIVYSPHPIIKLNQFKILP
jgi:hypothetical protein